MKIVHAASFLRRILVVDAALSSVMALPLILGAGAVAAITALPEILLRGAGWALVPWVALVVFAATREPLRAVLIWAIVLLNVAWVIESITLLFMDSIAANNFGIAFVVAQALGVGVLAALEAAGLLTMRRPAQS